MGFSFICFPRSVFKIARGFFTKIMRKQKQSIKQKNTSARDTRPRLRNYGNETRQGCLISSGNPLGACVLFIIKN